MAYSTTVKRHKTREVGVDDHVVGGDQPIWVQSMTTTNTFEVEPTVAQIHRLEEAGCEIARVTVPKKEDVEACKAMGVAEVFGPGSSTQETVEFLRREIPRRRARVTTQ